MEKVIDLLQDETGKTESVKVLWDGFIHIVGITGNPVTWPKIVLTESDIIHPRTVSFSYRFLLDPDDEIVWQIKPNDTLSGLPQDFYYTYFKVVLSNVSSNGETTELGMCSVEIDEDGLGYLYKYHDVLDSWGPQGAMLASVQLSSASGNVHIDYSYPLLFVNL